ncbi:MAG: hypothetical protein A2Y75_05310 [Candidatus Solincola sediminis]|uniref:Uncharacterized protein n=1 Tax=Candidatus Solincola sediminis TaxID=1797199 RepID=A0A1F2WG54_9ACTN|nr:MAG: hypothetical protein A2Y75_05310 [Candidatus Solincola sediminis]
MTRKFTDNDVHTNVTHFVPIVLEYLAQYEGDFELLHTYKTRLVRGAALTVPMVRAVLNSMMVDGRYDNQTTLAVPPVDIVQDNPFDSSPDIDPTSQRPLWLKLKSTWPRRFGVSTSVNARKIHTVATDSFLEMNTNTREIRPRLHWDCKPMWSMSVRLVKLLTDEEAIELGNTDPLFTFCKRCEAILEKREILAIGS